MEPNFKLVSIETQKGMDVLEIENFDISQINIYSELFKGENLLVKKRNALVSAVASLTDFVGQKCDCDSKQGVDVIIICFRREDGIQLRTFLKETVKNHGFYLGSILGEEKVKDENTILCKASLLIATPERLFKTDKRIQEKSFQNTRLVVFYNVFSLNERVLKIKEMFKSKKKAIFLTGSLEIRKGINLIETEPVLITEDNPIVYKKVEQINYILYSPFLKFQILFSLLEKNTKKMCVLFSTTEELLFYEEICFYLKQEVVVIHSETYPGTIKSKTKKMFEQERGILFCTRTAFGFIEKELLFDVFIYYDFLEKPQNMAEVIEEMFQVFPCSDIYLFINNKNKEKVSILEEKKKMVEAIFKRSELSGDIEEEFVEIVNKNYLFNTLARKGYRSYVLFQQEIEEDFDYKTVSEYFGLLVPPKVDLE